MFREIEPLGGTAGASGGSALRQPDGGLAGATSFPAPLRHPDGGIAGASNFPAPLRHPDGTINFDAYRERARRARTEAIRSSVAVAFSLVGIAFSA